MKNLKVLWIFILPSVALSCSKVNDVTISESLPMKISNEVPTGWQTTDSLVDGIYAIVTPVGGNDTECIEVCTCSKVNGLTVHLNTYEGYPNQQWEVTNNGDGYYRIINRYSGKALEVPNADTTEHLQLDQWTYNVWYNQRKWKIDYFVYGCYVITNRATGKIATLDSGLLAPYTKVTQTTPNPQDIQLYYLWKFKLLTPEEIFH